MRFDISERCVVNMAPKRKRLPAENSVLKIMLLSALKMDYKSIAKKVKYSEKIVSDTVASTPEFPLDRVLQLYNGDYVAMAKEANCSEAQVRETIRDIHFEIMRLKNLILQREVLEHNASGHRSSVQSVVANSTATECKNDSNMVIW